MSDAELSPFHQDAVKLLRFYCFRFRNLAIIAKSEGVTQGDV
jgi:hypothetical protein